MSTKGLLVHHPEVCHLQARMAAIILLRSGCCLLDRLDSKSKRCMEPLGCSTLHWQKKWHPGTLWEVDVCSRAPTEQMIFSTAAELFPVALARGIELPFSACTLSVKQWRAGTPGAHFRVGPRFQLRKLRISRFGGSSGTFLLLKAKVLRSRWPLSFFQYVSMGQAIHPQTQSTAHSEVRALAPTWAV